MHELRNRITLGSSIWVSEAGVFPGLGESTIVPGVTLSTIDISDVAELSVLDILLDWVELFRNTNFNLRVGSLWDFKNEVENSLLSVNFDGDIVPWGDSLTILLCRCKDQ